MMELQDRPIARRRGSRLRAGLALLAALLACGRPGAATALELVQDQLANGVRLVVADDPATPVVRAVLWIEAGRAHNPRGREGLADLAARCDAGRVLKQIRNGELGRAYMANTLSVSVRADHTRFEISALPEHLDAAMEVLRALVPAAGEAFPSAPLLKRAALGALLRNRLAPSLLAHEACSMASCGQRRPLGRAASFRTIFGLDAAQLETFHRGFYVPASTIVSVSGPLDAGTALGALRRHFGDWPAATAATAPWARSPARPPHPGLYLIDDPNAERALIVGGIAGPGRESDHYADLQLLHLVLSGGAAGAGVRRLTAGNPLGHTFAVQLRPSARGALLTVEATVSHALALDVLQHLRAEVRGEKAAVVRGEFLRGILRARRLEILAEDDDVATAVERRVPFLIAGGELEQPGYLGPIDVAAWRDYVRSILSPERVSWVIVGRASALAPALRAAGLEPIVVDHQEVAAGRLLQPEPARQSLIWETVPPTAAEILAAEELLLGAVDARGSFDRLERVHSYQATLRLFRQPGDVTLVSDRALRVRFPDHFREDWGMDLPAAAADSAQRLTLAQVIDGREVWRRQLGTVRPANARREHDLRFRLWRDPLRVLLRYGEPGTEIRLLEPEALAGLTLPGFELRSPDGYWVRLYLHPQSRQVVKAVYQRTGKRAPVLVEEVFTDYREVSGVLLPFKSAIQEHDSFIGEDHLVDIEFNVELPDAVFERTQY